MKKILVIDDNQDILHVVDDILTFHGLDVLTRSSGIGILKIVDNYQPNLILLDIYLSGMSGLDICKDLKEVYDIPILLFSAHTEKRILSEVYRRRLYQKAI